MSDVIEKLRYAMQTASNDDLSSEPGTEKRRRHVERLGTMAQAIGVIEQQRATLKEVVDALDGRVHSRAALAALDNARKLSK
jgi:hypothetical protein